MPMNVAIAWVKTVARAAPETPQAGIGPQPKMKSGSRMALRMTVVSTMSIGARTEPRPRMSDSNTK